MLLSLYSLKQASVDTGNIARIMPYRISHFHHRQYCSFMYFLEGVPWYKVWKRIDKPHEGGPVVVKWFEELFNIIRLWFISTTSIITAVIIYE